MQHSDLPVEKQKKLLSQEKSLRQRIFLIPELITGNQLKMQSDPRVDRLFGLVKHARDAFVHCEPGPQPSSKTGRIKEELFHNVPKELVDETVTLTCQLIREIWGLTYGRAGPRWLHSSDPKTLKRDLRLLPVD
jgi:hypothetical protein